MRRGEIWTVSGGPGYAGKPRPAIIVQSDKFDATRSVVICPLTSVELNAEPARFAVTPSHTNGLQIRSYAMVDKLTAIPKTRIGRRIGRLDAASVVLLNQHVIVFLGLTE